MTIQDPIRFDHVATNGIRLHVAAAGPADGSLIFLLHGFPEFWYGWRNHIGPLAERGFHVVAPDQRGYNLSDKPKGVSNYDLDQLAADVVGLADHFGQKSFDVVGHDWGGTVGWWLAARCPGRLRRLAVLNAAHPAVWVEAMRNNPAQRQKSRYVQLFRIPHLPEFLIGLDRSKSLARGFRDSTRAEAFTRADLDKYGVAWSQPGALTAMINYYRAALRKPFSPAASYKVSQPTLLIWGKQDAYAIPDLAEASIRLCSHGRIVYLDGATHWVQHDEPERVTTLLAEFLRPPSQP